MQQRNSYEGMSLTPEMMVVTAAAAAAAGRRSVEVRDLYLRSLQARRQRRWRAEHALDGSGLEQALQHAAGAAMLEALVRRQ